MNREYQGGGYLEYVLEGERQIERERARSSGQASPLALGLLALYGAAR